jgi:hypothetical protein
VDSDEHDEAYSDPVPVGAMGNVVLLEKDMVAQTTREGFVVTEVNVLVVVPVTLLACARFAR